MVVLALLVLILGGASGYSYFTLSGQVTAQQAQIADLNSQMVKYQTVSLYGLFTFQTTNCGSILGGNCAYVIVGPYANFGANTANSAIVNFIFYSAPGHIGQVLCQTTVVLGNVAGRSLSPLPQTTCSSQSPTQAQSWNWNFTIG